jgi:hypothetical protein
MLLCQPLHAQVWQLLVPAPFQNAGIVRVGLKAAGDDEEAGQEVSRLQTMPQPSHRYVPPHLCRGFGVGTGGGGMVDVMGMVGYAPEGRPHDGGSLSDSRPVSVISSFRFSSLG